MDNSYIAGGTLHTCPYTNTPEIVTFFKKDSNKNFDRSLCPNHSECTDSSCPLCDHLKG